MLSLYPGLAVQGVVNTAGSGDRLLGFESWLKNSFSKLQFLHLENRDDLNLPYRVAKKINEMPMKQSLPFITIPHSGHPWG